ncbi:MAG: hypothetical protein GTN59_02305 [Candidatus Dadabacteria bacterium]|nr:hypothetical protein [Candidatus Dadabacteria bacterium]
MERSGEMTPEKLNELKNDSTEIKNLRDQLDSKIEQLKIMIIKSSTHLLIEKVHRGDVETSLKILENTRDRSVFFDFISLFDELLVLYEKYYQKLDMDCSDIKDLKDNLGMNDHKIYKILSEMSLDM